MNKQEEFRVGKKVIQCHFSLEELEYISELMVREQVLTDHVVKSISGLKILGVELQYLERPNLTGKLLSYIKKART